jgi:hypothetical protein
MTGKVEGHQHAVAVKAPRPLQPRVAREAIGFVGELLSALIAVAFVVFVVIPALPDFGAHQPVRLLESCRAEAAANRSAAERFARVVIGCLNAGHCQEAR